MLLQRVLPVHRAQWRFFAARRLWRTNQSVACADISLTWKAASAHLWRSAGYCRPIPPTRIPPVRARIGGIQTPAMLFRYRRF